MNVCSDLRVFCLLVGFLFHHCTKSQAVDVFVSNYFAGTISKIDSLGNVTQFATVGPNPAGITSDAVGNLYVASNNGTISKIDQNGNVSTFASGLGRIWSVAFDLSGYLYTADSNSNTIYKIDSAGNAVPYVTSGLDNPEAVAFDPSGTMYVTNTASNHQFVAKVDPNGNVTPYFSAPHLRGMVFDSLGNLYVAVFDGTGSAARDWGIDKVTPDGVRTAYSRGVIYVLGMGFDSQGYLYAAEGSDARYSIVSPGGQSRTIVQLQNRIYGLVVRPSSVVPEPSSLICCAISCSLLIILKARQT